ncbi:MAG: rubrerythrin family protein [Candidatus Hinthialibacter antarcticus]|nr:rubrerythrin family protein [Candidatus Hinthialibacter antarcticus]
MGTNENLADAFAGESQANRRYLAFSQKADSDGFPQVAKLFRAAADAETIHAHAHLRAMDGVKDTLANLKEAVEGERYEFQEMYPGFLAAAKEEGNKRAAIGFGHALEAEEIHHNLYKQALEAVEAGKDLASMSIFLCPVCGNLELGEAPDKCPICNAPKAKFVEAA